ncbi:MAG: hypothetical protein Q7S84_00365 [bacterium]|nr:hypothetical protein [bacterium]
MNDGGEGKRQKVKRNRQVRMTERVIHTFADILRKLNAYNKSRGRDAQRVHTFFWEQLGRLPHTRRITTHMKKKAKAKKVVKKAGAKKAKRR